MYFITYIDRVNVATAAKAIQDEFGISKTEFGVILSGFGYSYALFQVTGGWLGDRWGPRRTLLCAGLVWAAATVAMGFAAGVVSMFLARLVLGFGEGATFPTASRAMQSWVPALDRGFAQGVTHSFARLGNAVAPPVMALLMGWLTWRGAFVAIGAISSLWIAVWFWYFRDNPRDHKGVTEADLARLPVHIDKASMTKRAMPWKRLALRMAPVTITYFCYGWTLWLYLNWLPSYFLDAHKLDIKNSAIFASGVFLAGVVGDTLGGAVSDRILHKTGNVKLARLSVIMPGMLGAALCLGLVTQTQDLTAISLLLAAGFFSLELVIGPIWSVPMDIAPQYSGTASGLMNVGSAVAMIVSPVVFGYVLDVTGSWLLPFAGSVGLLLTGAALSLTMHPERRFIDARPELEKIKAGAKV